MRRSSLLLALALLSAACGATPTPRMATRGRASDGNPLGPSYVLMPLPGEDDSLLGRVIPAAPEPGRSLEEIARANPCAEHLEAKRETPLASTFEYAEELSGNATAGALLGTFGFSADARRATHFVYKLGTDKRIGVVDKSGYAQCCAEKGCGYGYVSALVHGEGEYATGEESAAGGGIDIPAIASASGEVALKVLNKRKVGGYIAAVVTITDRNASQQLGPLGVSKVEGVTEATVSDTTRAIYENEKMSISPRGSSWMFTQGRKVGDRQVEVHENDFIERYHTVTGSDELDDLVTRRNTTGTVITGTLTGLGAVGIASGVAMFAADDSSGLPMVPIVLGTGAFLGGGIPFLILLGKYDGSLTSHYLTERDAQIYVHRYNRALLRRTLKDVEAAERDSLLPPLPLPETGPSIAIDGAGFTGSF
jgi:hypothetical protein